ncbi:PEP-CTERM sorting domain-containing protein [Crocosphaera sp. XPORK-15E]|uniref:PEP-CTERM sorting domain-containing protein n=1 Tax=Crocosphaera sp. XPORK-15E TaxID=3110247 RepID=UPI002B1ECA44|nr:PEP-CTERM sorting domain-containing protein [Crocosphaera sp. XPORK-15E]MEA5532431.1 PEP-CTERM sorting domain-containing protein [Crocosphaera sp. XPORK-15E]
MTILNPSKFVTRSLIGVVGLSAIAFLGVSPEAKAQMFPGGPADDNTFSLGGFEVVINPHFRPLFESLPLSLYDPVTFTFTSPLLSDPNTVIGRSDPHIDGDAIDTGGAIVGIAGRIISDSDFSIMPPEFDVPGAREVHTNVESLLLTNGAGFNVRVGNKAPDQPISPGEVVSNSGNSGDSNLDFPATSFFNVFAEVDIPGLGTVFNPNPLFLRGDDNLTTFPPRVVYLHEGSEPVRVYFKNCEAGIGCTPGEISENNVLGSLTLAGHGIGFNGNDTGDNQDDVAEFQFRLAQSKGIPADPRDAAAASIPEPSTTLGLLLFGLGSIAGIKRKGNTQE